MEQFDLRVKEITATAFTATVPVYVTRRGTTLRRGSFSKTLQEGGRKLPLMWRRTAIGTIELKDLGSALQATGRIVPSAPGATDVLNQLTRNGGQLSVVLDLWIIKSRLEEGRVQITEVRLRGVALVPAGAPIAECPPSDATTDNFRNAERDVREFHRSLLD